MSTRTYTLIPHDKPGAGEDEDQCMDVEVELDFYYERPDPEVGIMQGGYCLDSELPKTCPTCGYAFTKDELNRMEQEAMKEADEAAASDAESYEVDRYLDDMEDRNRYG
jgi:hypothetical protein